MTRPPALGVLGGTFDPVHLGHLEIARRARSAAGLARVLLVPSAVPPHKRRARLAPARDREAMLRLAVAGVPGLEVSTIELDTRGVCYTIETLRRLRLGPPAASPVFILGMDSLVDLETWKDFRDLIREFDLIAVDRPGRPPVLAPEIAGAVVPLPDGAPGALPALELGRGGRIFRVGGPPIPISSSDVRAKAASGADLDGLVPPGVAGYISSKGLYELGEEEENR